MFWRNSHVHRNLNLFKLICFLQLTWVLGFAHQICPALYSLGLLSELKALKLNGNCIVLPLVNIAFFVLVASNQKSSIFFFLEFLMNFICHGFEPFLTLFLQVCFMFSSCFHLVLYVYVRLAMVCVIHQKLGQWWRKSSKHDKKQKGYGIGTLEEEHTQLSRTLFPNAYLFLLL